MLRNYLKIAFRNLRRRAGFAFINILGFAVGLAACLIVGVYLYHEFSYDRFHDEADRIYRLAMRYGSSMATTRIPARAAQRIASDFPEVAAMVRLEPAEAIVLRNGQPIREEGFFYADASFFRVFSFRLKRGNPWTALAEPNTVVLTEEAAARYFPGEDPLGRTLTLRGGQTFRVTGVLEQVPTNSHLRFDLLASFGTLGDPERWSHYERALGHQSYTYFLLPGREAAKRLEAKLAEITDAGHETSTERLGFWFSDMAFGLQPLTEVHLQPFFGGALQPESDPRTLYVFAAIVLFVLAIACVNYMNLATARSTRRAREVGMRKTLGARRPQLIGQFMSEALLTTLAGAFLALFLARGLLPVFSGFMGVELSLDVARDPRFVACLAGILLVVGLVSGSYPALVLSRFRPVAALKGSVEGGVDDALFRKGLIVFQFAISIALIAGTFVAYQQLHYMRSKDLGYRTDHIVTLSLPEALRERAETFKAEVLRLAGVRSASYATGAPTSYVTWSAEHQSEEVRVHEIGVDEDYLQTMGISLAAGRDFSGHYASDTSRAIIVNETAARVFGVQDKVGEPVDIVGADEPELLIGIARNFHTASLHEPIQPVVLSPKPLHKRSLVVRLAEGQTAAALDALQKVWTQFVPDHPFTYEFLDETLARQYRTEQRVAALVMAFSGLAILLACLGLFGLAAYAAERRTKEIGIRKVLGATARQIVVLLSTDFLKLVAVAFTVAVPVAYWAMSAWLEDFAYRIELGPWIFLGAGTVALGIALLTVSSQAIRAALTDPAQALRYE